MAKNEYKLVIEISGEGESSSPIANSNSKKTTDLTAKQKIGVGIFTAYTIIDPFVKKSQSIMMDNVQTQYANTELSNRLQIAMDMVNKTTQIGANIIGGATLAKALGLSTKFGVGVGLLLSGASMALDLYSNINKINNQRLIENESLQVLRGRAGIQFNRSRGGE